MGWCDCCCAAAEPQHVRRIRNTHSANSHTQEFQKALGYIHNQFELNETKSAYHSAPPEPASILTAPTYRPPKVRQAHAPTAHAGKPTAHGPHAPGPSPALASRQVDKRCGKPKAACHLDETLKVCPARQQCGAQSTHMPGLPHVPGCRCRASAARHCCCRLLRQGTEAGRQTQLPRFVVRSFGDGRCDACSNLQAICQTQHLATRPAAPALCRPGSQATLGGTTPSCGPCELILLLLRC